MLDILWYEVCESVATNSSELPAEQKSEKGKLIFLFIFLGIMLININILGGNVHTITQRLYLLLVRGLV
jgi:hypothetical protein